MLAFVLLYNRRNRHHPLFAYTKPALPSDGGRIEAKFSNGKDVPWVSQLLAHIDSEKLSEMALVDIAYEILRETKRTYNFRELMDELVALRKMTNEQLMAIITQVYTEINIDGRYVCLGDNTWGLKRWYPTETVDENQEGGVSKKKKVVLEDDFDDYDSEDELVEEEEDDVVIFEDEEEFVDEDAEVEEEEEEIDAEIEEEELEEELEEEEEAELFEEEELAEEETAVDSDEDDEEL